jgi:hypothetical protein
MVKNVFIIKNVNGTKRWFFENVTNTDKPIAKQIKRKIEKIQISEIRDKGGCSNIYHRNSGDDWGMFIKLIFQ